MRHLYEIAVITSFTAAPTLTSTAGSKQSDSVTSLQQDPPRQVAHQLSQVAHQLHPNHYWTPASWNFPTGQGDNVWTPASVSSMNPVTGQPWCVENAPCVSKFTSEESTCSWETGLWSRESLVSRESRESLVSRESRESLVSRESRESLGSRESMESLWSRGRIVNPTYTRNDVPCDPRVKDAVADFERFNHFSGPNNPDSLCKDVTFISGHPNPDDLWRSNSDSVDTCAQDFTEDQFDQVLLQVAHSSSVLAVNQTTQKPWPAQNSLVEVYGDPAVTDQTLREVYGDSAVTDQTLREVYGDTAVTNQTLHNGFQSQKVGEAGCQFYLHQQNHVSGLEYSASETSNAIRFQMHHGGDSLADSGLVSRSSSLASLVATSSDTSEGHLADVESCESIARQRVKTLKGKTSNTSSSDKTNNSSNTNTSTATSQINYQPQTAAFTSTIVQNVGLTPSSFGTTSECSESVASYSLSSDSERIDLPSQVNCLDFTQWTRMKQNVFNGFPSTTVAFHSTEAPSTSTSRRPKSRFNQNSHMGVVNSSFVSRHVDQHPQNGFSLWDSGFENMGDVTQFWDASSVTNALEYVNENSHPIEAPQYYVDQKYNSDRTCHIDHTVKLPVHLEMSPYNCSLNHDSEFIPFQSLDVQKLPLECQGWRNLQTILEISYRVVKLRVHKQFKMTQHEDNTCEYKPAGVSDDDSAEPVLQHYGTGFACHVDKETVVIRTHSELVGSSLEASTTDVVFAMAFADGGPSQEITCKGLPDNFSSNDYSKTSRFTCRTPAHLLYYMHLFKDVPVVRHNSLFNDSCYFTDSSPDISASGPEDLGGFQDTTLQRDKDDMVVHPDVDVAQPMSVSGGCLTTHGNTGCLYSHVLANRTEKSVKDTAEKSRYHEGNPRTNTPADSLQSHTTSNQPRAGPSVNMTAGREHAACDSFVSTVNNTFFSPADELVLPDDITIINSRKTIASGHEYQSRPDENVDRLNSSKSYIPWQNVSHTSPDFSSSSRLRLQQTGPESSPLAIMERRHDELNAASGTQFCPYVDQDVFGRFGTYTSFSSYAGEVFSSCVAPGTAKSSASKTDEHADSHKWDYEKLLFLQNHHRDPYNKLHKPVTSHAERGRVFPSTSSEIANKASIKLSTDEKSITAQDIDNQRQANDEMFKASTRHPSSVVVEKPAVDRHSSMGNTLPAGCSHNGQPKGKSCSLLKGSGCNHDSTSSPSRAVFAEFASVQSYLDTWDMDLLNLDTDLSQIPDMDFFETMVNNLLESSDDEEPRRDTDLSAACCPRNNFSKRSSNSGFEDPDGPAAVCLIISFPHGGPKMLSTGLLSRHGHLGGVLYDTPTCMGSCGAPVLVLTQDTETPFLTHFVHSGTVKVNGVPVGAGVAYFDKLPSLH